VRVRLFAGLRESAGWGERSVVAPSGATPCSLWQQLDLPVAGSCDAERGAGELPAVLRVAINHAFAAPDTPLADGDELAFLPPISGG
jgi:molybdopterin synthase sulfur carrier subunit